MKSYFFFIAFALISFTASAQFPRGSGFGNNSMMNVGHFYGKVVDSLSGKPIEFASVQLWGTKRDSGSNQNTPTLITGMITQPNGDFSFDGLPVLGKYTLKINFIGYKDFEENISFNIDVNKIQEQAAQAKRDMSSMINAIDKDLGNIKLATNANLLKTVVVEGSAPVMELKFDKKVFNVEKNITTTGGTAEDVLKNVPSVNVDIDGNVTLRNAAPQIFVDGKPTTLTLDQIPADAIESVELITNPSAKYDASGGQAGILNIVLKKARKIGYNGNIRAGIDQRGKFNIGGDLSSREGKINVFLSGNYNQRKSEMTGQTNRSYLFGTPLINIYQNSNSTSNGYFSFIRGGFDWFLDNRNTLTLSGSYPSGSFSPDDMLHVQTDSLYDDGIRSSFYTRTSTSNRKFNNPGGSLQYKHIFPKAGQELTADINYNGSTYTSSGFFQTQYYDANNNPVKAPILQRQNGNGTNQFFTAQTDYANPIGDSMKIETGLRGAVRNFTSHTYNYLFDDATQDYNLLMEQNNNYRFTDEVYAAYMTFSQKLNNFSYQIGLRGESSYYNGELLDSAKSFSTNYPLALFPSAALTYSLKDKGDFQLNYSRRINRPNFRQLIPFVDYSDSLNLSKGNPDLKPEFTNSLEFSYLRNFDRSNNLLISLWYKNTTDLITHFQANEFNPVLNKNVIVSTFENASSGTAYGLELTSTNAITKWFNLTSNVNFYKSEINGTNLQSDLSNNLTSWFGKLNAQIKLPKNFSMQLIGTYQSKTAIPINSGGGGGGMMFGGNPSSTVQGYIKPVYGADAALKYEFLKNKAASLTLNVADIFKTRQTETYSQTDFFTQSTLRIRDQQFFRLNFSYKFGKFDVSLFKRKNAKVNTEGMDNMAE